MKRLMFATAVLTALPVLAAEQKATSQAQPATETAQISPTPTESPLAAAAKRAKRSTGKKRIVITDQDLKDSKGHVTTTKIQPQFNPDPIKGPTEKDLIAAKEKEKAAKATAEAEAAKKAGEEKKKLERRARRAEAAEGSEAAYGETDPAEDARPEEEPAKKPQ